MGELMFNKLVPMYRSADSADSESWIQVLDKVLVTFNDDTLFIFGHGTKAEGAVRTKKQITDMRNFLEVVQGKSVDIILKEHHYIPGFENRMSEDRLPQLIKNIYEQKKIN